MPDAKIKSNTGDASIKMQGHTATTKHGSNPQMKGKGQETPRDLKAK